MKQAHQDGYTKVRVVVGDDRVKQFQRQVITTGKSLISLIWRQFLQAERDPDAEGVEGMSASKMRKAVENDFKTFRSGMPKSIDDKEAKMIMATIRKRMKVEEGWNLWEIAPKFDWEGLRENYINKVIFKVDDIVEDLNSGLVGKIIRRGANYLICVTEDNMMFKSWIKDVNEKVENYPGPGGIPADQREIGTDAHREYVMRMTGTKEIRNFINKYKKKTKE